MVGVYFCGVERSGKSNVVHALLKKMKLRYKSILGVPERILERFNVTSEGFEDKNFFQFLQKQITIEQCKEEELCSGKNIISDHCVLDSLVLVSFKLKKKIGDLSLFQNSNIRKSITRYNSSLVVLLHPLPVSRDDLKMNMSADERTKLTDSYKTFFHENNIHFLDLNIEDCENCVSVVEAAIEGTIPRETSTLSNYDLKKNRGQSTPHCSSFSFYQSKKPKCVGVRTITLTEHEIVQSWTYWGNGKCNRFIDKYGTDKLAILAFGSRISTSVVQNILLHKVYINGLPYSFLGCDSSGLKKRKCYMWQGSKEEVDTIVQENGEFDKNLVSKKLARFGLLFSEVQLTSIPVPKDRVIEKKDIFSSAGKCFTDGCGGIGRKLARDIFNEIKGQSAGNSYLPVVYQIRYQGFKGVLTLDPSLEKASIMVRPSMKKFETSVHDRIGICGYSRPFMFGHLIKQYIQILSGLGVPDHVFEKKQEAYFQMIDTMESDTASALTILNFQNEFKKAQILLNEHQTQEERNELKKCITRIQSKLVAQSDKLNIVIQDSRKLYGVCDPIGILKYGECFLRITSGNIDTPKTVHGHVVLCKSPCYLLGDLKVLKAVDSSDNPETEKLNHLVDCIVFPVQGKRPHPDEMSGSDLDGDEFFVCWDEDLIPPKTEAPYDYPAAQEKPEGNITVEKCITYFAKQNQTQKLIGRIDSFYKKWANEKGVGSDECKRLGQLFSRAVDSVKSGETIRIPVGLIPPDEEPDMKFIWQKMEIKAKQFKSNFTSALVSSDISFQNISEEFVEDLLNQELSSISEYQKFLFAMKYIQSTIEDKEEVVPIFLEKYLECINFAMFSPLEQREAVKRGISNELVTNALNKSKILSRKDLAYFGMHCASVAWKFYFRSGHENLNWNYLLKALTMHDNSLLVMQMPEEIIFVLYFRKKCQLGKEIHVMPGTVTSYFFSQHFRHRKKYILGPEYKVDLSDNLLQLYRQNKNNDRSNTFIWLKPDGWDSICEQKKINQRQEETVFPVSVDLTRFINNRDGRHPRVNKTPLIGIEVYVQNHASDGNDTISYFDTVHTAELDSVIETKVLEEDIDACIPRDVSFMNSETDFDSDAAVETLECLKEALKCRVNNVDPILFEKILTRWMEVHDMPCFVSEMAVELLEQIVACVAPLTNNLPSEVVTALSNVVTAISLPEPQILLTAVGYLSRLNLSGIAVEIFNQNISKTMVDYRIFLNILSKWHVWFYLDTDIVKQIMVGAEKIVFKGSSLSTEGEEEKRQYVLHLAKLHLCDFLEELESYRVRISRRTNTLGTVNMKASKTKDDKVISFYQTDAIAPCYNFVPGKIVSISHADYRERRSYHACCCLARVLHVQSAPLNVTVRILEKVPVVLAQCLNSEKSSLWKMDVIGNIAVFDSVMNCLTEACSSHSPLLNSLMKTDLSKLDTRLFSENSAVDKETEKSFPFIGISEKLSLKQKQVVQTALEQTVTLIEGFPGTGKTTIACEIIKQIKRMEKHQGILVVAETNQAVDNIVTKLREDLPLDILRIGTDDGVDRNLFELSLDGQLKKIEECEGQKVFYYDKYGVLHPKVEFVDRVMKETSVVLTTCAGAGNPVLKNYTFEFVLVEEASKIKETTLMCSLVHGANKIVMIGDTKHFGSVTSVPSQMAKFEGLPDVGNLKNSMFHKLCSVSFSKKLVLDKQHRMHAQLAEYPSKTFYNGDLTSSVEEAMSSVIFPWPDNDRPLCFINVDGFESIVDESYCNKNEVYAVQTVLDCLLNVSDESLKNQLDLRLDVDSISLVTPYRSQVKELKKTIQQNVHICSIDGFQGRENEVILVSTVRANNNGSLGFLEDESRMCILLTRARRGLIVVGNMKTLQQSKLWSKWLRETPELRLDLVKESNIVGERTGTEKYGGTRQKSSEFKRKEHREETRRTASANRGKGLDRRRYCHKSNTTLSDFMPSQSRP